MKNILTHLTGIVAFLIAGACSSADDPARPPGELDKVEIFLKVYEKDGVKHLEMYDSNKPNSKVINDLYTEVERGTKIIWRRAKDSGIKSIRKVAPVTTGEILVEDASTILLNLRYRARVPDEEIDPGTQQKYMIIFEDKRDREETSIDPYLKIRGVSSDSSP